MNNKFDFHNISTSSDVCLLKIKCSCSFKISTITGDIESEYLLTKDGYYRSGKVFTNLKLYYDPINYIWYLVRKSGSGVNSFTIEVSGVYNTGYVINNYVESFDHSSYTELGLLNFDKQIAHLQGTQSGAGTVTYTSKQPNYNYYPYASIVMISARLENGVIGNGLYYMHKTSSSDVYTLTSLSADSTMTNFNITGTTTGFTIGSTVTGFRYYITEIYNMTWDL